MDYQWNKIQDVCKRCGGDGMSKIEEKVIRMIQERALTGKEKYGTTMEREDLSISEWLLHLQQELLDGAIYIEKLKGLIG